MFIASKGALEWAVKASSAMAASTGCTRNAVGLSFWQRTLITDVHSARELHTPWMADLRGKFVGPDKLEVVASFCYLGDMLSAAGGCELSTTKRVKTAWKKFKELLLVEESIFSFWYVPLWDLHIPREKLLNYMQTVETLIRRRILLSLIWVCTVCQLPFYGYPDYNGLTKTYW